MSRNVIAANIVVIVFITVTLITSLLSIAAWNHLIHSYFANLLYFGLCILLK